MYYDEDNEVDDCYDDGGDGDTGDDDGAMCDDDAMGVDDDGVCATADDDLVDGDVDDAGY